MNPSVGFQHERIHPWKYEAKNNKKLCMIRFTRVTFQNTSTFGDELFN